MSEDQWHQNPNQTDPSTNKEGQLPPPPRQSPYAGMPPSGPTMPPTEPGGGAPPPPPRYSRYPPPPPPGEYQPQPPMMPPPPHDPNQQQSHPGYPPPPLPHSYPPQGWGQPQYPPMYSPYHYPHYAAYYPPPPGYDQPPPPYGAEPAGYPDPKAAVEEDDGGSYARMKLYVKSKVPTRQEILDRRERKNAQSRSRAAKMRDRIKEIAEKPAEERTEEEATMLEQFEARRQRKNDRSRERAIEKKSEIDRILNKPERKRSKLEKQFLETALSAKQRKNEGDRLRRQRIKVMGKKGPVKGVQARPPGSAAALADAAAKAAKARYEQQLPISPLPTYAYPPPPMGYPAPPAQNSPKQVAYMQGGGQYDDAPTQQPNTYEAGGEDGMPPMQLLYDQENGGVQEEAPEEQRAPEQM